MPHLNASRGPLETEGASGPIDPGNAAGSSRGTTSLSWSAFSGLLKSSVSWTSPVTRAPAEVSRAWLMALASGMWCSNKATDAASRTGGSEVAPVQSLPISAYTTSTSATVTRGSRIVPSRAIARTRSPGSVRVRNRRSSCASGSESARDGPGGGCGPPGR